MKPPIDELEHAQQVGCHRLDGQLVCVAQLGVPDTTTVGADEREGLCEGPEQAGIPVGGCRGIAVDEHQGRTVSQRVPGEPTPTEIERLLPRRSTHRASISERVGVIEQSATVPHSMQTGEAAHHPQQVTAMAQLSVRGGHAAVEFYKAAFGASEVYRVGGSDAHEPLVSQLIVGAASFWVADESPEHANFSPATLGGGSARMLLVVPDPDVTISTAVAAGAREVYPAAEEHGWRLGRIEDPFGHHWEIGRPLIEWPPTAPGG